jgi:hypothetical protein
MGRLKRLKEGGERSGEDGHTDGLRILSNMRGERKRSREVGREETRRGSGEEERVGTETGDRMRRVD